MQTQRTNRVRRIGILSGVVLASMALGGCTGTYVFADHGWHSNSWVWVNGHRSNRSHAPIQRGSHWSGSSRRGSGNWGSGRSGRSGRGSGGSHSSGRSGGRSR